MVVRIDLNEDTLLERWPLENDTTEIAAEIAETIEGSLGVDVTSRAPSSSSGRASPPTGSCSSSSNSSGTSCSRASTTSAGSSSGAKRPTAARSSSSTRRAPAYKKALNIEGVDASRTTCNNIHEVHKTLGIEAAREAIIDETMSTLEEQGPAT